jgi:hypothetical protein
MNSKICMRLKSKDSITRLRRRSTRLRRVTTDSKGQVKKESQKLPG